MVLLQNLEKIVEELATAVQANQRKMNEIEQYSVQNCLIFNANKEVPS